MARPPLHALSGFIAAARLGNLSRAAESMHLTVSALSHQIKSLEERLHQQLFVREARGVRLTADGKRLLERIGPHMDGIEDALRPGAARHDDMLTLSLTPSMASAWLVPRLGGFLALHPQIQISLLSSEAVVDFGQQGEVDAALRIGKGQWPGVTSEHLFDEWVAPVASPELVERHGPGCMDRLGEWPLIGEADDGNEQWLAWFVKFGGTPPQRYAASFDDSEALLRGAASSVGVALGRLTRARLLLESGQLVRLSGHSMRIGYGHYLVYPPRSANHAGLQAFRSWLLDEARRYAATLEP